MEEEAEEPHTPVKAVPSFTVKHAKTPFKAPRVRHESLAVYLRLKPCAESLVGVLADQQTVVATAHGHHHRYKYTGVLPDSCTQHQVYAETCAPLVHSCVEVGHNALVFAYGVTNSGKTHTVLGSAEDPGVTLQVLDDVFHSIPAGMQVWVSALEVYNEEVLDLLGAAPARLQVLGGARAYAAGLTEVHCPSLALAVDTVLSAVGRRSAGSTRQNPQSSRSHALVTVKLVEQGLDKDTDGVWAKICVADLAGSEKAAPGASKAEFKETVRINSSLTTLGRCLRALRSNSLGAGGPAEKVSYRDSKLTRLFQEYFEGTGRVVMLTTACGDPGQFQETAKALEFGSIATDIVYGSTWGPDPPDEVQGLRAQILALENQVDAMETTLRREIAEEFRQETEQVELQLEKDLDDETRRLDLLFQRKVEILRGEYDRRVALAAGDASARLVELEHQLDQARRVDPEVERLREQVRHTRDHEQQVQELTHRVHELEGVETRVLELERALESVKSAGLEEQLVIARARAEGLEDEVEDADALRLQVQELELALEALQRDMDASSTQASDSHSYAEGLQSTCATLIAQLEQAKAATETLDKSLEAAKDKLAKAKDAEKTLKATVKELKAELKRSEKNAGVKDSLSEEVDRLEAVVADLEEQLDASNESASALEKRLVESEETLAVAKTALAESETTNEECQARIAALEEGLGDANVALEDVRETRDDGLARIKTLEKDLGKSEAKHATLAKKLDKAKEDLAEAKKTLKGFKADHKAQGADMEHLQARIAELESDNDELQGVVKELQATTKQLQDTEADLADVTTKLEKQSDEFHQERQSLLADKEERSKEFDNKTAALELQISELESRAAEFRDQRAELESQIATLESAAFAVEEGVPDFPEEEPLDDVLDDSDFEQPVKRKTLAFDESTKTHDSGKSRFSDMATKDPFGDTMSKGWLSLVDEYEETLRPAAKRSPATPIGERVKRTTRKRTRRK